MEGKYYKTKEYVDEYIHMAKGYSGEELIKKLKQIIPQNSNLLEIGSGTGTDWKILNEYFQTIGSDNSQEFLNRLINENPNGKFLELDASTLKTNNYFEGIYSNKVMHHLSDNELIHSANRQYEILNSNGIICHSFWKGEGSEVFKELYVNFHNVQSLRNIFENYFEILSIENYKEFEDGDSLLLIGRKK